MSKEPYTSAEWNRREATGLWKRVWQLACRENDIPEIGDQIAYDIVGQSVIVVRTGPAEFKAYHNACQHRGTRLLEGSTNDTEIQCPFHAWTWNLDGTLKSMPCAWDFPAAKAQDIRLKQVQVGTWNGFVFINLDPAAGPLDEFLGPQIVEQWKQWPRERTWKAVHYGKIVPCNWKSLLHTFIEVYHTLRSHPEALPYAADCNAQYDFYGAHSRMMISMGVPSLHVGAIDEQSVVDAMVGDTFVNTFNEDISAAIPQVPEGSSSREVLADFMRGSMEKMSGADFSDASDTEMLDSLAYHVFPNMIPWGGYALPIVHRFRPDGTDHRSCLWELMILHRLPAGAELPKDVALTMTPPDELWADLPELGFLGVLLDQDIANLNRMQRGMESDGYDGPCFANYQERNIRNFETHVRQWADGH